MHTADRLILLIGRGELADGLSAQNDYAGIEGMAAHGFSQRFVKKTLAKLKPSDTELSDTELRALDFAVYWSFYIFIHVLEDCSDILNGVEIDDEKWKEIVTWLELIYPIPILTAGELEWWGSFTK